MKTSRLSQAWRFARLFNHLLLGLLEAACFYTRRSPAERAHTIERWSRQLCVILGVEVSLQGQPPGFLPTNTMLVANHTSWLDIFVMNAGTVSRFVAKAEVRSWPLLGWLCQRTGTLFVTRERRHDTRRVNNEITSALAQGDCIAVFPEGGTTDGFDVATFNASLLQPAIDAGAQIIPVALCYYNRHGERSKAACYVGEMSLLESMLTLLAEPGLRAELTYFPPIATSGGNRRDLARQAQTLIRATVHHEAPAPTLYSAAAVMAPEIPDHHQA
ncbi:lysophospholipid acyltransferase family protein [Chitinimonas naiadis]